jgi:hypothetical protein
VPFPPVPTAGLGAGWEDAVRGPQAPFSLGFAKMSSRSEKLMGEATRRGARSAGSGDDIGLSARLLAFSARA